MSDHVNPFIDITLESLMHEEPSTIESLLQMSEDQGWDELFDWEAYRLGAYMQPSTNTSNTVIPQLESAQQSNSRWAQSAIVATPSPVLMPSVVGGRFLCSAPGCQKSYKRRAEWSRHALTHATTRDFKCSGQGCRMGFTRKDKLVDHMRAGHDVDALFTCPKPDCETLFTIDILPLHVREFSYMQKHRKCPMPRCKFSIADVGSKSLDILQIHLRDVHNTRGRKKFADVLAARGYHFEHAEIICPLCPDSTLFEHHEDFYKHFIVNHHPDVSKPFVDIVRSFENEPARLREVVPSLGRGYGNGNASRALRECKLVTDEIQIHCRTILSLWPDFEDHPVWNGFKSC